MKYRVAPWSRRDRPGLYVVVGDDNIAVCEPVPRPRAETICQQRNMTQMPLFDHVPPEKRRRGRPGWTMVFEIPQAKQCGGVWRHDKTGWTVEHCGHPTANWPYFGQSPDRDGMLLSQGWGKGFAFRTLELAQIAVEREIIDWRIKALRRSAQRPRGGGKSHDNHGSRSRKAKAGKGRRAARRKGPHRELARR